MAKARSRKSKTAAKTATASAATKKAARKSNPTALPAAAAKAALDRATKDIKKLQKGASKNVWAIGRRLTQVAELGLHKSRGFPSIEAYAEKELKLARDNAFLYMRVAQAFNETMTATFGTEKLDRALRYIAATPEEEKPADIPKLKFRVPAEDGKTTVNKSFEQVTISDLRRAVENERKGGKKGGKKPAPKWLDEEAASAIESGNKALDKAVGSNAGKLADVTVRRLGDEIVVDVRGVPLGRAEAAFKALATALK
jgi:hypothetical protein